MLERALPLKRAEITLDERLGLHRPAEAITLLRDLRNRLLQLLSWLGDFIARGGPLS